MNDKSLLVATTALDYYGLENAQLKRLGGASNANFKVDIDNQSFVLRLHTCALHDRDAISSELAWLNSLHNETTLVLPQPIVNLNGKLVTSVCTDGEPETLCTLMSWIEGKIPPTAEALTNQQLAEVGSIMAQLHKHSQHFELPEDFRRHTFDAVHFSQRLEMLCTVLSNAEVNKSDLSGLQKLGDRIIAHFAQIERTPDNFGVIHADFHSGNYLLCGDKVHIIDFDRCGFGFYIYDLALALMELEEHQRQIFLQGYETIKQLPTDYANLKLFLCLAYLDNLGFFAPRPEELVFIVKELPFVVAALRHAVKCSRIL